MAASRSQLLLLRHGIAEERMPTRADAARSLTAAGRRRTEAVLERAVAMGIRADRLIASPLTRARQTAEIAVATGLAPAMELATVLEPGADPLPLLSTWLDAGMQQAAPQPPTRLALVGHEPDLGLLAARLLGAAPGSIRLRKAGFALLEAADASDEGGAEVEPGSPPVQDGSAAVAQTAEKQKPGRSSAGLWQLQLLLTPRAMLA